MTQFKRLSNDLYQLSPPGDLDESDFDVLFIHGLQIQHKSVTDAYWKTWTTRDGICWPAKWLGEKFPKSRILSFSYDSSALDDGSKWRNLWTIAQGGLNSLLGSGLGKRPLFIVGHSLGGLIGKALVNEAFTTAHTKDAAGFRSNLRGMIFYGVPHMGADLAEVAERVLTLTLGLVGKPSPLLKDLERFGDATRRLSTEFNGSLKEMKGVCLYAFVEGKATKIAGKSVSANAHQSFWMKLTACPWGL
jgi:hypothetical protein